MTRLEREAIEQVARKLRKAYQDIGLNKGSETIAFHSAEVWSMAQALENTLTFGWGYGRPVDGGRSEVSSALPSPSDPPEARSE